MARPEDEVLEARSGITQVRQHMPLGGIADVSVIVEEHAVDKHHKSMLVSSFWRNETRACYSNPTSPLAFTFRYKMLTTLPFRYRRAIVLTRKLAETHNLSGFFT